MKFLIFFVILSFVASVTFSSANTYGQVMEVNNDINSFSQVMEV